MQLTKIDSVWMAISVDEDGIEGVCGVRVDDAWMPLVAADGDRLPFILANAEMIARGQGRLVKIIRLHNREEVSTIDGRQ